MPVRDYVLVGESDHRPARLELGRSTVLDVDHGEGPLTCLHCDTRAVLARDEPILEPAADRLISERVVESDRRRIVDDTGNPEAGWPVRRLIYRNEKNDLGMRVRGGSFGWCPRLAEQAL